MDIKENIKTESIFKISMVAQGIGIFLVLVGVATLLINHILINIFLIIGAVTIVAGSAIVLPILDPKNDVRAIRLNRVIIVLMLLFLIAGIVGLLH